VGLLEKSLKKAGKTRTPAVKPAKVAEEKRSVGWLSGSFGERTSALADKIDLEAQYARLEAMSESHAVAPPKMSLRERALRMLTGSAATKPMPQSGVPATAQTGKSSLRDRAAQFMRKLTGGGSGESGAAGGSPESSGGYLTHTQVAMIRTASAIVLSMTRTTVRFFRGGRSPAANTATVCIRSLAMSRQNRYLSQLHPPLKLKSQAVAKLSPHPFSDRRLKTLQKRSAALPTT
jgi:hypothetical protein